MQPECRDKGCQKKEDSRYLVHSGDAIDHTVMTGRVALAPTARMDRGPRSMRSRPPTLIIR